MSQINFRRQDVLGHIGGDEFVVFMPNAEKQDVLTRCQKLRAAMRRKLGQEENVVHLTGSIGIAFAPEHGADYHTLFSHADSALYEAKRRGRDSQVIYDEAMEERQHMVEGNSATSIAYHNMMAHPSDYIFRLVLHSKDTAISVRLLLEIFAKHFHVQRAYVFWNIDGSYFSAVLVSTIPRPFIPGLVLSMRSWRPSRTSCTDSFLARFIMNAHVTRERYIFREALISCGAMDSRGCGVFL